MTPPSTGSAASGARSAPGDSVASTGAPASARTAGELFTWRVRREKDRTAFRALPEGGAVREEDVTWRAWGDASRRFAAALIASGHAPGEKVAILAGSTPVWPIADLGVVLAGLVSVGLYPSSAPAQIARILRDCEAPTVVVQGAERCERVLAVRDRVPGLERIVAREPADPAGVMGWTEWLEAGDRALEEDTEVAAELERRSSEAEPGDVALLIYTSGSTGEPKGARISHRYLLASAASIQETLGLTRRDSTLSFLPHSHAAERVFGLYTRIYCGMQAGLVADHTRVWEAARAYRPTVFGGLPRFYEKIAEALRDGSSPRSDGDEALARLLGGNVRLATSGGAPLPPKVAASLERSGLTVLGAYGLTEHLCVACNRPDRYALDSAGPPMPGTQLRFAADGEILVRAGDLTFSGYHGRPEASRAAFTPDGEWLKTGDLGTVDDEGFLRVTGRKKELIALSTGKKVAPAPIETALAADPWIARAVLYGEGRKFVSALLIPRRAHVERWCGEHGLEGTFSDLLRHPEVERRLREAVDRVNAELSRTERVRRFALLERELSEEEGEVTPTGKVRRAKVVERHADRLEALYD